MGLIGLGVAVALLTLAYRVARVALLRRWGGWDGLGLVCRDSVGKKLEAAMELQPLFSSGSQTRTDDLWVMSPTSYHCSIPRCDFVCKGTHYF